MYPTGTGGPPPGWYPDPAGARAWRWWDGARWTEWASDPTPAGQQAASFQSVPFAYPPTVAPGPSVRDRFASEARIAPWARIAFVSYPVILVVSLLIAWAESSILREVFHSLRVQLRTGVIKPVDETRTTELNLLSLVDLAVSAPFLVLVPVWQYHAAKTAQLLSLPARRSPGLGVGSWFIPIVNFWFPYQSIRDCVRPGDAGRDAVARMWAFYVATLVLTATAQILALTGSPVAFGPGAAALATGIGFGWYGARSVRLIREGHRVALALR